MDTAFGPDFRPFAKEGQLIALQGLGRDTPAKFFRVISVEPVPTLLITIAASASNERQQTLESGKDVLIQWRFNVVTAVAEVVLKSPRAARSYATAGGGQGFVATTTDTDWGTVNDRSLTEFFFLGGENEEIRFDNLAATAATAARFAGWKHYLTSEVESWTMRNPANLSQIIEVKTKEVPVDQLHLLENFAGIVPQFLTRG